MQTRLLHKCSKFCQAGSPIFTAFALLVLGLATSGFSMMAHAEGNAARKLTVLKGDLYQFTSEGRSGVVLVTNDGIAIGDPLDTESAKWLQSELDSRFGLPVKYVFYSHMGKERSEGGQIFAETGAIIIAHENALRHTDMELGQSLPGVVFSDNLTISLGGNRIVLKYAGESLRDDILFAHFPDEQAVFTSDLVSVERISPADFSSAFLPQWFATIDKMNRNQFVYLLDGYGGVGIQNDGIQYGYYLRELHNKVVRGTAANDSLTTMQREITMERYKKWAGFGENVSKNVEGISKALSR